MQLSVIIPCWNAEATIAQQLEALRLQHWSEPWEIIVADNGSTDATQSVVQRYQALLPHLRLVNAVGKQSAAFARNVGAQATAAPLLAFCDADDEVGEGWVAAIGTALKQHDFVASRFEHRKLNPPHLLQFRRPNQAKELMQHPFLPHAGACGLGIKRSLHQQIGGFDEAIQFLEDNDYCWRLQLAGVSLQFVAEAVVHIRYRETLFASFFQAQQWGECSVLLYQRFLPQGYPLFTWKDGWQEWFALAKRLLKVRSKGTLAKWLRDLGWRIGRVKGALKYRIFAL
ncbi:MAG: glycosyltransferase [Cyanobacteria bacterium Co-bin13]|nr:glycosyltransferase [Cyanobacteria bacterium Co-bin13]